LWEPVLKQKKKEEQESEGESEGAADAAEVAVPIPAAASLPPPAKRNSKIIDRPLEKVESTQMWRPKWGLPGRPNDWKKNGNRGTIDVMREGRI